LASHEGNGIVGGGVAGVQGRHHVNPGGQLGTDHAGLHAQRQKAHARKAQALRQLARPLHQLGAGFDAVHMAHAALAEKPVVQHEAQI
jgi:hypothetical protein